MSSNKYFNLFDRTSEQNLIDELNKECIAIHGLDCLYLPRNLQKTDLIFGEDVISKFDDYHDICLYIKNIDSFGEGDMFRKFGLDIKDQITFTLNRTHFAEIVNDELLRPKEGDLIYFPLNNALFEIKFVEHESVFYNLGQYYVYDLQCERFVFEHEDIKTGIDAIDEISEQNSYRIYLNIGAGAGTYQEKEYVYQGASLATATAQATVIQAINPTGKIEVRNIIGFFDPANGNVIGETSGASYVLTSVNEQEILGTISASNPEIEADAGDIIDFSEGNPFSEIDEF